MSEKYDLKNINNPHVDAETTCPYCKGVISAMDLYCPICGRKLKGDMSSSVTFFKQLAIYLVSLFFPPFGLFPAIQHLRQSDEKSKKIGLTALVLTTISTVAAAWLFISMRDQFGTQLNSQLELYQDLGF